MKCMTDFNLWLSNYGPQNYEELLNLERAVRGTPLAGCYSGAQAKNKSGWHVRRDGMDALSVSNDETRKGFQQLLWYYRAGRRGWHKHPKRTIEELMDDF
jgi:hypothetical protein